MLIITLFILVKYGCKGKSKLFPPSLPPFLMNCYLSTSLSPGKIENNPILSQGASAGVGQNYPEHRMECLFKGTFYIDPVHLNMGCVSFKSNSFSFTVSVDVLDHQLCMNSCLSLAPSPHCIVCLPSITVCKHQ